MFECIALRLFVIVRSIMNSALKWLNSDIGNSGLRNMTALYSITRHTFHPCEKYDGVYWSSTRNKFHLCLETWQSLFSYQAHVVLVRNMTVFIQLPGTCYPCEKYDCVYSITMHVLSLWEIWLCLFNYQARVIRVRNMTVYSITRHVYLFNYQAHVVLVRNMTVFIQLPGTCVIRVRNMTLFNYQVHVSSLCTFHVNESQVNRWNMACCFSYLTA